MRRFLPVARAIVRALLVGGGLAAIAGAAFMVSVPLGFLVLGVEMILVGTA